MTEPQWNDITGLIRTAADGETIELKSDSKITQDVTEDLKRGVKVNTKGYRLWTRDLPIGVVDWKPSK